MRRECILSYRQGTAVSALIKCSDCGQEVSRRAVACPKCGAPVEAIPPLPVESDINYPHEQTRESEVPTRASAGWRRSSEGKVLGGVCAGLAERFGAPVIILRAGFLLTAALGGGIGILIYLALLLVMSPPLPWPGVHTECAEDSSAGNTGPHLDCGACKSNNSMRATTIPQVCPLCISSQRQSIHIRSLDSSDHY